MNVAIILVVVIVVGAVGYFLVTRSKTDAPLPMDQRTPVQVVAAPGDVKAAIDDAAIKAAQTARLAAIAPSLGAARLALTH